MKMTRSEIKSIIKECLVEILNEGLGGMTQASDRIQRSVSRPNFSETRRRELHPSMHNESKLPTSQLKNAIKIEAGGNKIMESILADTAASTLPKMLQGDSKSSSPTVHGGLVEQVVASTTPEEIFGKDASSKWADLAFMNSSKNK